MPYVISYMHQVGLGSRQPEMEVSFPNLANMTKIDPTGYNKAIRVFYAQALAVFVMLRISIPTSNMIFRYAANRADPRGGFYSDDMIFSSHVCLGRKDVAPTYPVLHINV